MDDARCEVRIVNKRGLHARASAKFVAAVAGMEGVQVMVRREDHSAAGGSILGLMMLGAAMGDCIELSVSGKNAQARLAELAQLVESGFGED